MKYVLLLVLSGLVISVSSCSKGKYSSYSDQKIRSEHALCERTEVMSPARGVACSNYKRECIRRKKAGNNICIM